MTKNRNVLIPVISLLFLKAVIDIIFAKQYINYSSFNELLICISLAVGGLLFFIIKKHKPAQSTIFIMGSIYLTSICFFSPLPNESFLASIILMMFSIIIADRLDYFINRIIRPLKY